jgi:hypothetical protein
MRHVASGRQKKHKGWAIYGSSKNEYYKRISSEAYFVSPDGVLHRVINIKKFSRHIGISQGALTGVWIRRKHYNSAKGWRRATEDEIKSFDQDKHRFWNYDKFVS